jgi:hypothetical protein
MEKTLSHKEQMAYTQGRLYELKRQNADQKKRLGWESLTDEETKWLMDGAWDEHFVGQYFHPPREAHHIKKKYAEVMGIGFHNKFEKNPEMENPSAWIDRGGRYHPVGFAEHDAWAREYLINKHGHDKAQSLRTKDNTVNFKRKLPFFEVLEKYGWVRIMKWEQLPVEFVLNEEKLTHAQKQTLDKYCEIYQLPLPFKDPLFE